MASILCAIYQLLRQIFLKLGIQYLLIAPYKPVEIGGNFVIIDSVKKRKKYWYTNFL